MSTTPETVPTAWSADDDHFFRVVADVFAPTFLWGGSALLGSYDPEPVPTSTPADATLDAVRTEPAAAWPLAA